MCPSYRFPIVVLLVIVSSSTNLAVKLSLQHRSQVAYQYPAIKQRVNSCERKCISQGIYAKPRVTAFVDDAVHSPWSPMCLLIIPDALQPDLLFMKSE